MPETKHGCNMNKNNLLTLYFHEGIEKEEQEIQKHVAQCEECRTYLLSLEQVDQGIHLWQDETPLPNTWDLIEAQLLLEPAPVKQKQSVPARSTIPFTPITPIVTIIFSAVAILTVIFFLHDKITLLPVWQTIKEYWYFRFLGTFGVTAALVFLLGFFFTLAITPVLILEAKTKKYRYYFN
jgi:hypothetical protein